MIQRVGSPAKPRKWMSVHEMGDMLGLKKTDRYWLVHKNYFRTETLLGKMRVEIASFEKWYANQDWYHKVNGEAPGKELRLRSYSPKEIQEMLGTDNATVYEILKKNNIETVTVNERMRVPTDAFWDWYYSQSRYRTQEDRKKDAAAEAASLSMPEMARLLDVPRSTVYGILSSKKYAPLLDVIVIAGRRRVTKESFERFLQAQDTYELFNFEYEELELKEKREYENYKRRCLAEADHSQEKKRLEYLTVPEAAELAGVEPATIAYWYTIGKISVRKTGKIIRIPREAFEQWLLKRKEKGGYSMASIQKKNNKYCVVYYCKDTDGKRKQKWETYDTKNAAKIRKAEIELKEKKGGIIVSNCKTLEDLINEYVELYGKDRWALSTYDGNMSLLKNYILPIIGKTPLTDINTRFLEIYYKTLTKTPSVPDLNGNVRSEFVSTSVIRDVHKLLKSCFNQAVKWDIMEKNPAFKATVPKHKSEKRVIWDAETFAYALDVCENECLKLCMNLAFAGSLRIGELLGLTWDCVDISEEAIKENRAYLYVNKEVQRVSKKALEELDQKDVIVIFPEERKTNKTVRIMKTPKTESSVRKVFLPRSVAEELIAWKAQQEEIKDILQEEYQDYGLILATEYGLPRGGAYIRDSLNKLIKQHDLPQIVFHSFRHMSVTYKLKLNGGDIKAVQGDSGHAQADMVTEVYSHIIDEDRRRNATLLEDSFYNRKNLNPQIHDTEKRTMMEVPEGVDAELLAKVLSNPEMAVLLTSLAKSMQGEHN